MRKTRTIRALENGIVGKEFGSKVAIKVPYTMQIL